MEVKGTALKTTRDYVKTNFPNDFKKWLDRLPDESRKYYDGVINSTEWYDIQDGYIKPIELITEMFFEGDAKKCGDTLGQYSADVALKGFYKVFIMMASPKALIQRATKIVTTFYQPSEVEAISISPNSAGLKITKFDVMNTALEYRFAGWCKKALELSNCKNVTYSIKSSLTKKDSCSEIIYTWE